MDAVDKRRGGEERGVLDQDRGPEPPPEEDGERRTARGLDRIVEREPPPAPRDERRRELGVAVGMAEDATERRLGREPRDAREGALSSKFPCAAIGHVHTMPIFLTGATGYVGGRLLESLVADGREVRALTRDASRLDGQVEVVEGDVRDDLTDALADVDVAYYLVHSLGTADFGTADREAAQAFAASAEGAGVGRIVYLGGLGRGDLSPHLASRQEVGRILRDSGVPTIEFRASVVIGEGSVSYDTFTTLAQLPLAVLPDWIDTPSQPIAIDDVVAYLVEAADIDLDASVVYEIGGADVVPYRAILDAVGGRSVTVPAPELVASVATMLKPLQPERAKVVSDLFDSLRIDTTVQDDAASSVFSVRPRGLDEAVAAARSS